MRPTKRVGDLRKTNRKTVKVTVQTPREQAESVPVKRPSKGRPTGADLIRMGIEQRTFI